MFWVCCLFFVRAPCVRALPPLVSHRGICGLSECHDLMKTDVTGAHAHTHTVCLFSFLSEGYFKGCSLPRLSPDTLPCLICSVCFSFSLSLISFSVISLFMYVCMYVCSWIMFVCVSVIVFVCVCMCPIKPASKHTDAHSDD